MTNEEYIKSLPTELFAKYLTCRACYRGNVDDEQDKCFGNCEVEQIDWLKAKYENN